MTREQIEAWLILEGWTFSKETGDHHAYVYRYPQQSEGDSMMRCELCVVRYTYASYHTAGTRRAYVHVSQWEDATIEQLQLIYQEIIKHEKD